MKLLVMTDTHIRGTTPGRRMDNFKETLLKKLKEVKQIAIEEEVDFILHGGDLFDRPDTAPSVVNEFINVLCDYPVPIYLVAGNHDLFGHNPETLPRTMLGVLVASGVVNLVSEEPILLSKDGIDLQLTGKSFDYEVDSKNTTAYSVKKAEDVDYALHLVHGMLLERPFFDQGYTLIEDVETEADLIVVGHYHLGFGKLEFNGTKFLNPGALARISADLKEIKRKPQVALVDFKEEIDIQLRELETASKGAEVLDRSEIEDVKFREKKLANFIREVKATEQFKVFSSTDILDKLATNNQLESEVVAEARERIGQAQERLGGSN
ncbi:metallophosphoesterase [Natroniella sulfidigena]|uniref:metallophosphoesterase family protein n=1 Tax=Natroniella sulfidigena TaxID=723921 RepID=UPI00200A9097|nr:metallophosphoesterase [Natroniella sulfidigena]MCK8817764.1 metallophosphoesterase [Natroniella sulfidigena]